jgi:hypothetical protein
MGTGITDVIDGPHDFLPPKSDEFQKLCPGRSGPKLKVDSAPFEIKYF